eukprot:3869348-Amphidinium_carterae.1
MDADSNPYVPPQKRPRTHPDPNFPPASHKRLSQFEFFVLYDLFCCSSVDLIVFLSNSPLSLVLANAHRSTINKTGQSKLPFMDWCNYKATWCRLSMNARRTASRNGTSAKRARKKSLSDTLTDCRLAC